MNKHKQLMPFFSCIVVLIVFDRLANQRSDKILYFNSFFFRDAAKKFLKMPVAEMSNSGNGKDGSFFKKICKLSSCYSVVLSPTVNKKY